jgi:hypothetical protein
MAITDIKIDTIEPFAEQQTFGAAGSYVRIKASRKAVPRVPDPRS